MCDTSAGRRSESAVVSKDDADTGLLGSGDRHDLTQMEERGESSMSQEKVGFIGLGNLGKVIADNIAKGGFEICVYDIVGAEERAPEVTIPLERIPSMH